MSPDLLNAVINLATGGVLAYAARQLREIRDETKTSRRIQQRAFDLDHIDP